MTEKGEKRIKEFVKKHYTKVATCGSCCETPQCCGLPSNDRPGGRAECRACAVGYSQEELEGLPDSVVNALGGCGNPTSLAELREGETVLDLGSGGGIDVFLAARRVGSRGRAIGVDMTEKMVQLANKNAEKLGVRNVEFRPGEIENLPVEDETVDVVISNCVINLSPDKDRVFREAFRVLKPGGRMLISDVVTQGELPRKIRENPEMWARCVAGALDEQEYLRKIRNAGFQNVEVVNPAQRGPGGKVYGIHVRAYKPRD